MKITPDELAGSATGWWIDLETVTWSRGSHTVTALVGPPDTAVRFHVGVSRAPTAYRHRMIVKTVVDLRLEHRGDYPFAQPIERCRYASQILVMTLGFGSEMRITMRTWDVELAKA